MFEKFRLWFSDSDVFIKLLSRDFTATKQVCALYIKNSILDRCNNRNIAFDLSLKPGRNLSYGGEMEPSVEYTEYSFCTFTISVEPGEKIRQTMLSIKEQILTQLKEKQSKCFPEIMI